jgi:hypothetical protein
MIFYIQNMILKFVNSVMQSYFVYMPDNRLCAAWGCTAVSTGHTLRSGRIPIIRRAGIRTTIISAGRVGVS